MKKIILGFILLFVAVFSYCQTNDIILPTTLTSWIAVFVDKHVWCAYLVIAWGFVSEIIGSNPNIKANTTWQLIFSWIGWIINLFKPTKPTNTSIA